MKTPFNLVARKLSVRALGPTDWAVLEALFGTNGACGGCWCMSWRVPRGGKLWEESKGEPNKRAFKRLVQAGKVHGCLAFADGESIGWCCIGPRGDFPRLARIKALQTEWDERTWSIVCFYIRAKWRNRGVATALLKHAVKRARELGARTLEGYPVRPSRGWGNSIPAAFAWTGVNALFENARFVKVTTPSQTRDVFRKRFSAPPGGSRQRDAVVKARRSARKTALPPPSTCQG